MRKLSLLLIMLLTVVVGAKAGTTKTSLSFDGFSTLTENNSFNSDKLTVETASKTITYSNGTEYANAALEWSVEGIAGYDYLVLELAEASTSNVEVAISTGGFWGASSASYIATGATKLVIPLSDLLYTNGDNKGSAVDLSKVNMIILRTGWTNSQTIKVKDFYFVKNTTDYDQVVSGAAKTNVDVSTISSETIVKYGDGDDSYTLDTENATLKTIADKSVNIGVGYTNLDFNIADYDRLVIKVTASKEGFNLRIDDNGTYGNYQIGVATNGMKATYVIDLGSTLTTNNDNGENEARAMSTIKRIWVWTMTAGQSFQFNEIYLEKDGQVTYLVRNNTTADKYGTICLPYAASIPTNATVYTVAGKDKDNTKIYLTEANSLEAGKAYIFKSKDANDVTFTKTGTETNLGEPNNTGAALVGNFAEAPISGGTDVYILNSNVWKNVSATGTATTSRAYRAYLDLSKVDEYTGNGAKSMAIGNGTVTGINAVENAEARVNSQNVYNLSGQRVSNGYKGVVIKNGKKYIVK